MKEIEISFGAFNSELQGFEYTIPDGYTAEIVDGKIIVKKEESEDEKIRKWIINEIKIKHHNLDEDNVDFVDKAIAWLEKQGEQKPTWSEEDEKMLTLCASSVRTRYNDGLLTDEEYEQASSWLKSLKDRITLTNKNDNDLKKL